MKNLSRYLILLVGFFVVFIFAVQVPFLVSDNHFSPTHCFVQPSCADFTRWVVNPAQYQNNEEICHGLGLIPAPVDRSVVSNNNPISIRQSKIIVPKTGRNSFEFF